MTYKQIETSREIRLWITGIVGPALIAGGTILASDQELRGLAKDWTKRKIGILKSKLRKEGA